MRSEPQAVRSSTRSACSSAATWLRRWGGSRAADGSSRAGPTASRRRGCGCSPRCRACSAEMPSVYPRLVEAGEIAERLADADAVMFARLCRGYALIVEGRLADGMALLDEVMVSVTQDEVAPMLAGIAYCQVIALCQAVFDLRRAREWTDALTRWCDSQPEIVPFRGNCLVHRCEILQLQGAWTDAHDSARQACEWLAGPPGWDSLGSAHYQLAEIQRLRGEFAEAEESYRRASLAGRDPEPGMSLATLGARASRSRASGDPPRARRGGGSPRPLAAPPRVRRGHARGRRCRNGATRRPRNSTASPRSIAAPYLQALAGEASGAVLLAEGDPRAALTKLRTAQRSWRELEAPHQAARVRLLIGIACRELGDSASAELEFEAARGTLEELGAAPDLERLARLAGSPSPGRSEPARTRGSDTRGRGQDQPRDRDRAVHQREDSRAAREQHLHEARAFITGPSDRLRLQARPRPVARATQKYPRRALAGLVFRPKSQRRRPSTVGP